MYVTSTSVRFRSQCSLQQKVLRRDTTAVLMRSSVIEPRIRHTIHYNSVSHRENCLSFSQIFGTLICDLDYGGYYLPSRVGAPKQRNKHFVVLVVPLPSKRNHNHYTNRLTRSNMCVILLDLLEISYHNNAWLNEIHFNLSLKQVITV